MARERKKERRNRRGSGSIRKRVHQNKDGTKSVTYEGRIDIGCDANGKRQQKSIYGKSIAEVELKMKEISLDVAHHRIVVPNQITVQTMMERWIDGGISQSPSTLALYRDMSRRYIFPHLGTVQVQKLTEEMIKDWIRKLQSKEYAIRKPLSDKSVKDVFAVLNSALNDAVDHKIIMENPCHLIKLRKPVPLVRTRNMLNETEIQELIKELRGAPHERFYLFSLFFGLREMENLGLTMSDIDMKKKVIHVRYQLRKNMNEEIRVGETLHFKYLKDHEQRDLCFGDGIANLLNAQIAEERAKKKRLGNKWPKEELERGDLLFSNADGSYLSYRTVYDCFKRRVENIGKPDTTIHELRHAYVLLAHNNGDSLKTVSEHLGHATPDFTLAVYDYVSNEEEMRSADQMSKAMEKFCNPEDK